MNCRQFVTSAIGIATPVSLAGCASSESAGRTYTLSISELTDDASQVLNFDSLGLAPGQAEIIETAIREGSYTEAGRWSTLLGRKNITMEFKMLLQLIAGHDGRKPSLTEIVTFDTPSRYEREEYQTLVAVDETEQ